MGFLGDIFAAKNKFQAQNVPLAQTDFRQQLQGSLGQPQNTINQQQQLANALQQQMLGGGPNLAETQLQAATDRNLKQAAALGASQRGMNPASAARNILEQQAGMNQAAANQAAQLRQQQQLAAQQQLAGVLGQQGELGLQQLGTLGNLQQGQNALNVQQSLGTQGMNLQAQLANQQAANNFLPGLFGAASGAGQGIAHLGAMFNEGGEVHDFKEGGEVPGKAKVAGDHPSNDTVPAMLSPGEIVIPRSVVKGADLDPQKVADFMAAVQGKPKPTGYARVLAAKNRLGQ